MASLYDFGYNADMNALYANNPYTSQFGTGQYGGGTARRTAEASPYASPYAGDEANDEKRKRGQTTTGPAQPQYQSSNPGAPPAQSDTRTFAQRQQDGEARPAPPPPAMPAPAMPAPTTPAPAMPVSVAPPVLHYAPQTMGPTEEWRSGGDGVSAGGVDPVQAAKSTYTDGYGTVWKRNANNTWTPQDSFDAKGFGTVRRTAEPITTDPATGLPLMNAMGEVIGAYLPERVFRDAATGNTWNSRNAGDAGNVWTYEGGNADAVRGYSGLRPTELGNVTGSGLSGSGLEQFVRQYGAPTSQQDLSRLRNTLAADSTRLANTDTVVNPAMLESSIDAILRKYGGAQDWRSVLAGGGPSQAQQQLAAQQLAAQQQFGSQLLGQQQQQQQFAQQQAAQQQAAQQAAQQQALAAYNARYGGDTAAGTAGMSSPYQAPQAFTVNNPGFSSDIGDYLKQQLNRQQTIMDLPGAFQPANNADVQQSLARLLGLPTEMPDATPEAALATAARGLGAEPYRVTAPDVSKGFDPFAFMGNTSAPAQDAIGKASEASLMEALRNPTGFDDATFKTMADRMGQDVDDEFAQRETALREEMARRGLADSSIQGGRLADLNVGRRSAQGELATQLNIQRARDLAQARAQAVGMAQNEQSRRFAEQQGRESLGLQRGQLGLQGATTRANLGLQGQQLGLQANAQQFNQGLQGLDFRNQLGQQNFANQMALQNARFNQGLQGLQLQNQLGQQGFENEMNRAGLQRALYNDQYNLTNSYLDRLIGLGQDSFQNDLRTAEFNRALANDSYNQYLNALKLGMGA